MRRWMLVLAMVGVLCPGTALAYLCGECGQVSHTKDIGDCVECKKPTSSGQFKLCLDCSTKLDQCEACRKPKSGKPEASPSPAESPASPAAPAAPASPSPVASPAPTDTPAH
ncbi:MAG: hypothetical protein HY815_18900 [Candidatus Riflebacteria bacterium]|nr:hypothetical protein [Candidatus Riflebacteria bacterium]